MQCKLNKPYPEIRVEKENIEYAKILLEDYAGSKGEDTAIHEYLFQSFIKKDISDVLKEISFTEMRHLEILGELITKLGGKPFYCNLNKKEIIPWTSNFVNYTMNLKDMLLSDILLEKETISRYEKHIMEIDDKYVKEILNRIIEDEKLHISCLRKLYNEYDNK